MKPQPSFDTTTGWVALPLLSDAQVSSILTDCQTLMQLPPDERDPADKPNSGTRHLRKLDSRSAHVAELVARPGLVDLIQQIVGEAAELQAAEFRSPQPGFGRQQLHADWLPKFDDGPAHVATVIVALVDFDAINGATRVVEGSDRRPDLQRQSGQLDSHPNETTLSGPAGTAFVFSGHLLHASGANNSDADRPALQLIWHRSGARSN